MTVVICVAHSLQECIKVSSLLFREGICEEQDHDKDKEAVEDRVFSVFPSGAEGQLSELTMREYTLQLLIMRLNVIH